MTTTDRRSPLAFSALMLLVVLAGACGTSKPYTTGPVKTFDPDNRNIPVPEETTEHFMWESFYLSTFYQLEKPLDLGYSFQKVGRALGVSGRDEAENVNALGQVPESSWYSWRHYHNPMDPEALKRGAVIAAEKPDTSRTITVIRGKSEGVTPGFTIKDANGNVFIAKMDHPDFPELQSSSEVIATHIYYACGYYVPQNSIAYLDPEQLVIAEDATITRDGEKQPMDRDDLQEILDKAYIREDGKIRVLASKYVEGTVLGPWNFKGKKKDDPNDRIPHEDRREVRGMGVIASWLNDTDRRSGNTLAAYIKEGNRGYIRHYLLDMGSTLGTTGTTLRHTKRGQEYRYDPRYMGLQYVTLGLYVKPWAKPEAKNRPFYPSVGYFEAKLFDPGRWVPSYPNPAFEKITPRDGFWGAKLVMSFSDEDVRAIVEAGQLSNAEAENYLVETLLERRDKIGRYWFGRINPLDKFSVHHPQPDTLTLSFSDLSVSGGLVSPEEHRYLYGLDVDGKFQFRNRITEDPEISLAVNQLRMDETNTHILKLEIYTLRESEDGEGKNVEVYIEYGSTAGPRIVGVRRES